MPGANFDHPRGNNVGMMALRLAARRTFNEAALSAQFLLSKGANPIEPYNRNNRAYINGGRELPMTEEETTALEILTSNMFALTIAGTKL